MISPKEWDAAAYERLSEPQFRWGQRVLERVRLRGDERVLDAGCGSGRLTALVLERVPGGHVVALDRSANMVAEARERLASYGARASFVCADLLDFVASPPVDAVFSTATFHWVLDHTRLFANLFASLTPGGALVAQCGGGQNLARFHAHALRVERTETFAPYFASFADPWCFATPDETRARLAQAGFEDIVSELEIAPTPFDDETTFREFVEKIVLRPHLARVPEGPLRERFLGEVVRAAALDTPPFVLDYERLNLSARRPA